MDKLLRLIIVDPDLNDAERMISTVKAVGYAVRARHAHDEQELVEALKTHSPDMVLYNLGTDSMTLEHTVRCTRKAGKRVPVLAVTNDNAADPAECMQLGAADLISKSKTDHFGLVVSRTAEQLQHWRELKRLEAALHESERRCRALLDSSHDAICYVHEGMHIYANSPYLELFGYTDLDDLEGLPIMDMVTSEHHQELKEYLRAGSLNGSAASSLEVSLKRESGETVGAELEFTLASIDGEPCTQIVIRDRAQAKELEDKLNYLKQRDAATGLFSRQVFVNQLSDAVRLATQGERNSAVIQIEISNVLQINQTVGIAASDLVIADIARILEAHCESEDLLARFSSECFTILTGNWEIGDLESFAAKLHFDLEDHTSDVEGREISPRVAIGAIQIDENSPEYDEVLLRCDKACKIAAKNSEAIEIYIPKEGEMTQKQLDALWENRIRDALAGHRVRLLYQPIVSLHGEKGERYSVFMQMIDEDGSLISAADFLPSAERAGTAAGLDRWVILNAFRSLAESRKAGADVTFFFKLTAGSVQDPSFLPWLGDRLRDSRVPPSCIVFGVKEDLVVNYLKQTKTLFKGLKQMNCKFAIDDFGTGLNPFQLLKYVPADYLKFDASLMRNLSENVENQETVRNLTDTAHSMNKLTIARFVEDATVLSVLWGMGVNYIQGNFLQAPSENLEYDFSTMG